MRAGLMVGGMLAVGLLSSVARAEANKTFASWRDKAQPVESLSQFLSDYIGSCDSDPLAGKECKAKVDAFRKKTTGQVLYVILGEDAQKMVQAKGFNPMTHEQEFSLTPYFDGSGFGLTEGQPEHTDADGNPVVPDLKMLTKFNESITHEKIVQELSTTNVKVQLVFRPLGVWRLPRKDKAHAFYEGVKSKFLAVRLSDSGSGSELTSLVVPGK